MGSRSPDANPRSASRIDVHAHFVPKIYRDALIGAGLEKPDGTNGIPEWSESAALAAMDELNIRKSVLSISSPGVHFGDDAAAVGLAREMNEEAVRLRRLYPDRFGFFACVALPNVEAAAHEAAYAIDALDADGIVVETNTHGMYLGDERLAPLYAVLDARRSVLFVHPTSPAGTDCRALALGYPMAMLEFMFETTRSMTQLLLSGMTRRFPNMRIIVPHAGAALSVLTSRIELVAGLFPPTAEAAAHVRSELRKCYYDLAGAPIPELLRALLDIAEPDHILYGSDWPWTPLATCSDLARTLDGSELLSAELRERVMSTNAARLLATDAHPVPAAFRRSLHDGQEPFASPRSE